MALGTGGANPLTATAEVVLAERRSEKVKGIKTGQEINSYGSTCGTALMEPRFQSRANNGFTWLAKAKCGQAFTDEEEVQNLPQPGIWSLASDSFVVLCRREQSSSNLRIVVNPGKT